MEKSSIIIPVN